MTRLSSRIALLAILCLAASPPALAALAARTTEPAVSPHQVDTVKIAPLLTEAIPAFNIEVIHMRALPSYEVSKQTRRWVQDGVFRDSIRQAVMQSSLSRDSLGYAILANLHDHLGDAWVRSYTRASRPSPKRYRLVLTALNDIARNRGSTA